MNSHYLKWLPVEEFSRCSTLDEADILLLEGGADISPGIYNDKKHPTTRNNVVRDREEIEYYNQAVARKIPIIGVCRGSQLICGLQDKGKLVQHQENQFMHPITTFDDKVLEVNSTHHQAQYPFDMDEDKYKLVAWSTGISRFHKNGRDEEMNPPVEAEIVFYPEVHALGIQHHPEDMKFESEANQWLRNILNLFLNYEI